MTPRRPLTWLRARLALAARDGGESGQALGIALLVIIVAAGLGAVIVSSSRQESSDTVARKARTGAMPHARSAVEKYELALKLGLANPSNNWNPPASAYSQFLDPGSDTTIANSATDYPTAVGAQTVVEKITNASNGSTINNAAFWQIAKIDPPRYGNTGNNDYYPLTVYFRAWVGMAKSGGNNGNAPRVFRAQYRPTYFSDYQMLTDSGIPIGPNFRITGHVHTNGFVDGVSLPPGGNATDPRRVWLDTGGAVACAGSFALVTTGRGTIDGPVRNACPNKQKTNRFVELTRAEDTYNAIESQCGSGVVACL